MKLLGFEIGRRSTQQLIETGAGESTIDKTLNPVTTTNTFWGYVREPYSGAWQQNVVVNRSETVSNPTVYACVSRIAGDIGKMRPMLMRRQDNGIWRETDSAAFSPVLRKPNHFQTRIKFLESWMISKLLQGNTYVLKARDSRSVVTAMYVLDPLRVTPLVSDTGDVYYELKTDFLSGLPQSSIVVPASEIIHDTAVTLFHPLCGVSPLFACALAATQGLKIQTNGAKLFANMSRPSGILIAPGPISQTAAAEIKAKWEANYSGENMGKTAVLGDGMKYEPMTMSPVDSQLVEQAAMSDTAICTAYGVPPFMVNVGQPPTYDNVEALAQQYYSQALQTNIESIELLLDEGLGLVEAGYGAELDLDNLLRMDTAARYKAHSDAIGGGWLKPNEARWKEDLDPVAGGDTPYMQQQNYSLAALNKRDTSDDPFKTATPPPTQQPPNMPPQPDKPPPPKGIDPEVHALIWRALLEQELLADEPERALPQSIVIHNQMPEQHVHVPQQLAPIVNVEAQPLNVQIDNHLPETQIHVASAPVHVDTVPPIVNVHVAPPETPIVNVAAPDVAVKVNTPTPVVNVTNEITTPAPVVNVEAAEAPTVNVNVEQPAPAVVNVMNEIPEFETIEQEVIRDEKGRTKGMKTTKRRRK